MKRVVTALFLVPIAVYSALFAPAWLFLIVVILVAGLCFREYAGITGTPTTAGYVAGLLILLSPPAQLPALLVLGTLAGLALPLFSDGNNLQTTVARGASLATGIAYIFGSWKMAALMRAITQPVGAFHVPAGRHWLMFGLMVNWIGDTGAYYVGKNFGRHRMAPSISPAKTWEGAAASAVTGVIFGMIYLPMTIPGVSPLMAGILALITNAAGQAGDFAESAVKRGAGVKDSGSLLPGHGGFLDRVDSTIFALPVLYFLLTFPGLARLG